MRNRDAGGTTQEGSPGQDDINVTDGVAEAVADLRACMTDDARDTALRTLDTDPNNVDAHLALARHYHFLGVERGTSDYLSIRDNEADDGSYVLRDHLVVDGELKTRAKRESLAQLPLAASAIVHAVKAVELNPSRRECTFALERCLEGIVDAGGTLLALATSDQTAEECAPGNACHAEGQTPPTSEA